MSHICPHSNSSKNGNVSWATLRTYSTVSGTTQSFSLFKYFLCHRKPPKVNCMFWTLLSYTVSDVSVFLVLCSLLSSSLQLIGKGSRQYTVMLFLVKRPQIHQYEGLLQIFLLLRRLLLLIISLALPELHSASL